MSDRTGIAWCDATVNFWWGCTEVSPGCDNCYARVLAAHKPVGRPARIAKWGPREDRVDIWGAGVLVSKLQNRAKREGRRLRVFTNSMSDFFDNAVSPERRAWAWDRIAETPELDWLVLTKRPQNITKMLPSSWPYGFSHVWLGVSAENQEEADRRIPALGVVPDVAVRWVSFEPLLGSVLFRDRWRSHDRIAWAVIGGESGSARRDCGVGAILALSQRCAEYGVTRFIKQDSAFKPDQQGRIPEAEFVREWPEAAA